MSFLSRPSRSGLWTWRHSGGQTAGRLSALFFVPPDNHLKKAPLEGQKFVEKFCKGH